MFGVSLMIYAQFKDANRRKKILFEGMMKTLIGGFSSKLVSVRFLTKISKIDVGFYFTLMQDLIPLTLECLWC
jgi:hypothetical protein